MSENQTKFGKMKKKAFAVSVALSVGLVAGIPMIVLGAVYDIVAVMVIGIVCTAVGFYGTPIAWTQYSVKLQHGSVLESIEEAGLSSVSEIAAHIGKADSVVRASVDYLIAHGFLKGYVVDVEGNIRRVTPKKGEYVDLGKCPNCNAPLSLIGGEIKCAYCGTVVRKRDGV